MTTLTKNEQTDFGKRICLLLEKNYGAFFSSSNEGNDVVTTLKIVSSDLKKIKRSRSYLTKNLKLKMKKVFKNHGSGMHTTLLIDLSDVSEDSIERVLAATQPVIKKANGDKKEVSPVVIVEKSEPEREPVTESVPETPVIIIPEEIRKGKDHDLKSLIASISWMLKSEGGEARSFSCDSLEPGKYFVQCINNEIARQVYSFLVWRAGDPSLVQIDKDIVLIDYVSRIERGNEFAKIIFCLSPKTGATSDEIVRRLIKVSSGSRPKVSVINETQFMVSYVRSNFSEKIFSALLSMGWNAEMNDKKSFIITVAEHQSVESISEEHIVSPVEEEEISTPSTNRDEFDLQIPQNHSNLLFGVENKEEALVELEKLFSDSELFIKLSPETQQRIVAVLKEEARKRNPEEFALNLLSIIGK